MKGRVFCMAWIWVVLALHCPQLSDCTTSPPPRATSPPPPSVTAGAAPAAADAGKGGASGGTSTSLRPNPSAPPSTVERVRAAQAAGPKDAPAGDTDLTTKLAIIGICCFVVGFAVGMLMHYCRLLPAPIETSDVEEEEPFILRKSTVVPDSSQGQERRNSARGSSAKASKFSPSHAMSGGAYGSQAFESRDSLKPRISMSKASVDSSKRDSMRTRVSSISVQPIHSTKQSRLSSDDEVEEVVAATAEALTQE